MAFVNVRLHPPRFLVHGQPAGLGSILKSTKSRKEGQETGSSHRLLLMQRLVILEPVQKSWEPDRMSIIVTELAVCVCMPNELLHAKSQ